MIPYPNTMYINIHNYCMCVLYRTTECEQQHKYRYTYLTIYYLKTLRLKLSRKQNISIRTINLTNIYVMWNEIHSCNIFYYSKNVSLLLIVVICLTWPYINSNVLKASNFNSLLSTIFGKKNDRSFEVFYFLIKSQWY